MGWQACGHLLQGEGMFEAFEARQPEGQSFILRSTYFPGNELLPECARGCRRCGWRLSPDRPVQPPASAKPAARYLTFANVNVSVSYSSEPLISVTSAWKESGQSACLNRNRRVAFRSRSHFTRNTI